MAPNPARYFQNGPTRMLRDPPDNPPTPDRRRVFTRPAVSKPLPPRIAGTDLPGQLRARRQASYRLPPLPCSCRDPWPCRHTDPPPTERRTDAYRDAVHHLRAHGLTPAPLIPEMRALRRRGEHRLVSELATRWELAG